MNVSVNTKLIVSLSLSDENELICLLDSILFSSPAVRQYILCCCQPLSNQSTFDKAAARTFDYRLIIIIDLLRLETGWFLDLIEEVEGI